MWTKIAVAASVATLLAGIPNLGYAGDAVGTNGTAHAGNGGPAIGGGAGPSEALPGNGSSTSEPGSATSSGTSGADGAATSPRTGAPGAAGSVPGVTGTGSTPGQTTTK